MKLLYDARYIRTDFHDGVSRYTTELGIALAKLTRVTFIICNDKQKDFLPKNAEFIKIHSPVSVKEPFTSQILNKYNPDVVFSPMQVMGTLGRKFKLILTSHDMIFYHHNVAPIGQPFLVSIGWRVYHATTIPERIALNSADMVATVSYSVEREFQQAKLTKRPIVVVPNAPENLSKFVKKQPTGMKPRNLVYMGSLMKYKNPETLIRGMAYLPGYTLHILSRSSPERLAELKALVPKKANVIFYNGVTDEKYAELLAHRGALVSASLDEGFGLPAVESLLFGVPAVLSNIPIFHEVAAGGALYFEPDNPKDFAHKVKELDNKSTRDQLIKHGKEHAKNYTWKDSARTLLNAINSLV
ncbi:MAG: glycosyltransferase family 1 protein [Candidatus Microsaccharimonas sp.]